MANFESIVQWLLYIEDDHKNPGRILDEGDGAGLTRLGLTQRWHQKDVPSEFFSTMSFIDAIRYAKDAYRKIYWGFIQGDLIVSDVVAAVLLSLAVNDNIKTAVKTLQRVLEVPDDGVIGPQTLAVLNSKDPNTVAALFRASWEELYRHIAAINPSKQQFLKGWINRVYFPYPAQIPSYYAANYGAK